MFKTKKKKSKKFKLAPKSRWLNRWSMLAVVLAVTLVGGLLIYNSFAATISTRDEKIQYNDIIFTRAVYGKPAQPAAECLTKLARSWSKTMAAQGYISHTPNFGTVFSNGCGAQLAYAAQNVGVAPCASATDYTCGDNLFNNGFASSQEKSDCLSGRNLSNHFCNIINTAGQYIGVGAYRDDKNKLWVTHNFYKCYSCSLTTYKPLTWTLRGVATASSNIAPRDSTATVHPGGTYTLYNDVVNDGPDTAVFRKWVHVYHYSSAGALLSSETKADGTITVGNKGVWLYKYNGSFSTSASIGSKVCSTIFFENKTGPLTGGGHSNKTCVTVVN